MTKQLLLVVALFIPSVLFSQSNVKKDTANNVEEVTKLQPGEKVPWNTWSINVGADAPVITPQKESFTTEDAAVHKKLPHNYNSKNDSFLFYKKEANKYKSSFMKNPKKQFNQIILHTDIIFNASHLISTKEDFMF